MFWECADVWYKRVPEEARVLEDRNVEIILQGKGTLHMKGWGCSWEILN